MAATAEEEIEDEIGLAGKACGYTASDADETVPAIIRGSRREPEERARVIIDLKTDDEPNLTDTDRQRVDVVS